MSVSRHGGATFSAGAPTDSIRYPGGDAPIYAADSTVAVAYLASSELQPAFFCEVSPQLAAERGLEHLGRTRAVVVRASCSP
jgi:hypothetical protein